MPKIDIFSNEEHLKERKDFSLKQLAIFMRDFKAHHGDQFIAYIAEQKIEEIKHRLLSCDEGQVKPLQAEAAWWKSLAVEIQAITQKLVQEGV